MGVNRGYKQSPEHVERRIAARLATLKVKDKPVSREWLQAQYWGLKRDCVQIGAELDKDPKTILQWMRHYGIPSRKRGGNTMPHAFQKGQPGTFTGKKHTEETRNRLRAIAKADGRVPYDPAIGSYMKGRKGADAPNWKGGITPERQDLYASDEWKIAVRGVYQRDRRTCQHCGKVWRRGEPFDVHHIVSFECKELRTVLSNLVLLCEPCHYWVHSKKNANKEFILPCPL